jgi:hypothetical protein
MHRQDTVAVVMSARGAVAFSPGEEVRDLRGAQWVVRGNLEVLDATIEDGVLRSDTYPDALARVWAALRLPDVGDVLLSAAPGRSSPTGAAPTTSAAARTGRCTAATRSARWCSRARGRRPRAVVDRRCGGLVRDHFRLRSAA